MSSLIWIYFLVAVVVTLIVAGVTYPMYAASLRREQGIITSERKPLNNSEALQIV